MSVPLWTSGTRDAESGVPYGLPVLIWASGTRDAEGGVPYNCIGACRGGLGPSARPPLTYGLLGSAHGRTLFVSTGAYTYIIMEFLWIGYKVQNQFDGDAQPIFFKQFRYGF